MIFLNIWSACIQRLPGPIPTGWNSGRAFCESEPESDAPKEENFQKEKSPYHHVGENTWETKAQDFLETCEKYNSPLWQLKFNSRGQACESETYCQFVGQAFLGKCVFGYKDKSPLKGDTIAEPHLHELAKDVAFDVFQEGFERIEYSKLLTLLEGDNVEQLLQTAAGKTIAGVAAQNMKEAANATEGFAKEMLQKILLEDPQLRTQTGQALRSLFADDTISRPIVWTVCDQLSTEFVATNSSRLLAKTVVWLLKEYDLTKDQAAQLIAYLIALPITQTSCSFLLDWVLLLEGPGTVRDLLGKVSAQAIPELQEVTNATFKEYANEFLKHPKTKTMAKSQPVLASSVQLPFCFSNVTTDFTICSMNHRLLLRW